MDKSEIWLIVANPTAGGGRVRRYWPKIEALLQQYGYAYTRHFTEKKGQATQLIVRGIDSGHRKILAIGGDGTNNEAINGIMQQQAVPSRSISYALLPIGTGNDWARTHRIPKNIKVFIGNLSAGSVIYQDIGWVSYQYGEELRQRYFANIAGMAYDAYLVKTIETQNKHLFSRMLYFYYLLKYLYLYQCQPATVSFDGQEISDDFYTINIGICCYAGGGMKIVPHARPNDGWLALTLIRKMSKINVLWNTPRLYTGSLAKHRKISLHRGRHIQIRSNGEVPVLIEIDGEFIGETPVECRVEPGALKIIIPQAKL